MCVRQREQGAGCPLCVCAEQGSRGGVRACACERSWSACRGCEGSLGGWVRGCERERNRPVSARL